MSGLQDFHIAMRSLRAHRGTALFATFTLALGLGAAIALYAVIDAVLLRDLPFPRADRIVALNELDANGKSMAMAWPNYADLAANPGWQASAFFSSADGPLANGSQVRRASTTWAGGDFFRVFGIAPAQGRVFDAREHEPVAVISHALWQSLLQGRSDAVGQSITVAGETLTIVGVMPAGFDYPAGTAVWTPWRDDPGSSRSAHNWSAVARLADDASLASVRLSATTLAARLLQEHGDDLDARAFGITPLAEAIAAPVRRALWLLAGGTLFLLLIAVTNVANLLLALNGSRARELAVRAALGATRSHLARQLFAESALIALAACVIGMALAHAAITLLMQSGGTHLPRVAELGMHADTLLLAVSLALLIAVATTAATLLGERQRPLLTELRESGRGQSSSRTHLRLRMLLLATQTCLTTVLLIGAGLLGRSFLALLAVDPGFEADGAMNVQLSRPFSRDPAVVAETARRYQALIDSVRALPGVDVVGGVNALPLAGGSDGAFWDGAVTDLAHAPKPIGYAQFRVASAGYFAAAGIPVLAGRSFDTRDRADSEPVALISAAAAHATWGDADPIGKRIQYGNMDGDQRILTIVGVVGDVRESRLDRAPMGAVYVNLAQRPVAASEFNLVVRTQLPLTTLAPALRQLLDRDATDVPHALAPLAQTRSTALAERRLGLLLLGTFAAVALVLAVGGLYGLMNFATAQRRQEFALRQALGASTAQIARRVVGSGLAIGGSGIVAGLLLSLAATRAMSGLLFGVHGGDPLTLASVSVLLLLTIVAACLVPARHACAVPPQELLR